MIGTLNLYDASLTSRAPNYNQGAGVFVAAGGKFNMHRGEIRDCTISVDNGKGGGVYVSAGAEFNMCGGKISGCKARARAMATR